MSVHFVPHYYVAVFKRNSKMSILRKVTKVKKKKSTHHDILIIRNCFQDKINNMTCLELKGNSYSSSPTKTFIKRSQTIPKSKLPILN